MGSEASLQLTAISSWHTAMILYIGHVFSASCQLPAASSRFRLVAETAGRFAATEKGPLTTGSIAGWRSKWQV